MNDADLLKTLSQHPVLRARVEKILGIAVDIDGKH